MYEISYQNIHKPNPNHNSNHTPDKISIFLKYTHIYTRNDVCVYVYACIDEKSMEYHIKIQTKPNPNPNPKK